MGINGGLRSQLVPIAIVNPKNTAAYGALIATTLIPSDKKLDSAAIMAIAEKSPVKRAIYHGGINEWMPMPLLENFSGYNRDTRQYIAGTVNLTDFTEQAKPSSVVSEPATSRKELQQDSVNSSWREQLRPREVSSILMSPQVAPPGNQRELVLMMLEKTKESSLEGFVSNELKLVGEQWARTLDNIVRTIKTSEREDLARKFNL